MTRDTTAPFLHQSWALSVNVQGTYLPKPNPPGPAPQQLAPGSAHPQSGLPPCPKGFPSIPTPSRPVQSNPTHPSPVHQQGPGPGVSGKKVTSVASRPSHFHLFLVLQKK